ncbi:hypothetical protein VTH06DRAFT_268 [Thermothelomyces fergusii]
MDRGTTTTTTENGGSDENLDSLGVEGFSVSTGFSDLSLAQMPGALGNSFAPASLSSPHQVAVPHPAAAANPSFEPTSPILRAQSMPQTPGSDHDTHSPASTLSSSSGASKEKRYLCTEKDCNVTGFGRPCDLRRHMKKHGRQTCPYCNQSINAFHKSLERHLRRYHSDLPEVRANPRVWKEEVSCQGCKRRMRADNRNRHVKTCRGMQRHLVREAETG